MEIVKEKPLIVLALTIIICLGIGYGIGYTTAPPKIIEKEVPKVVEKVVEKEVPKLRGEILIGYIAASPTYVEYTVPAVKIAEAEVNEYLKSMGWDLTIKVLYEHAEGSAVKALEKVQSLYARGVKFLIGPGWSSMCKAILDYCNENKILIVSEASTAPYLAIPNDFLYRLPATDNTQCKALAYVLKELGIKAIVVIQRADAWGDGNYEYIKKHFEALGGVVYDRIRYSTEKTEFSAEVKALADAVSKAADEYGKDKIAIGIWSFEEIIPILSEAAHYPILFEVIWVGSDGIAFRMKDVIKEAGDVARNLKVLGMIIGATRSSKYETFHEKYVAQTGTEPRAYDIFAYDALWMLTKAILEVGEYNPEKVQKIFPKIAEDYFGAGGWYKLDDNGDRFGATFEIFTIVEKEGKLTIERAASFDMATMKTSWIFRPEWLPGG